MKEQSFKMKMHNMRQSTERKQAKHNRKQKELKESMTENLEILKIKNSDIRK